MNHHLQVPFRTLEKKYTFGDADSDNMIIHGDNLEALKALLPKYEGKINCIYIDPPYNTGAKPGEGGWVYYDNVDSPRIRKWLGQAVGDEFEDLTRHDKWLCMMYPRLKLLQKLLKDDGAIFISIGEEELDNLIFIGSEIFGGSNKISVIGRVSKTASDKGSFFAPSLDFIVVFAKKVESLKAFVGEVKEDLFKKVETTGEKKGVRYRDDVALYQSALDPLRGCANQRYYIKAPDNSLLIPPGNIFPTEKEDAAFIVPKTKEDKIWRWTYQTYLEKKNLLVFKETKTSPLLDEHGNKAKYNVYTKSYLDERLDKGAVPRNIWIDFINRKGADLLKKIGITFGFPKPVELVSHILKIMDLNKDAIILDSFAGSGTTAQAVLEYNKKDGGNRKFILVEMEDYADNLTAERVKRVIKGYGYDSDVETTVYSQELTTNNLKEWPSFVEDFENEAKNAKSEFDRVVKRIEDNSLKVVGINKAKGEITGTGGGFAFYELGVPIFDADGYLNETVGTEKMREYIWYSETHEPYNADRDTLPYLLGNHNGTDYYFYYEPNRTTTLDKAFLNTIAQKAEQYVIYADNCLLSESFMQLNHIVFKKIPRDIRKF